MRRSAPKLSNKWLTVILPTLEKSKSQELLRAALRLRKDWQAQEGQREAFWAKVAKEEEERSRKTHLETAGERRLQAAENFLVVSSEEHYRQEISRLLDTNTNERDNDKPNDCRSKRKQEDEATSSIKRPTVAPKSTMVNPFLSDEDVWQDTAFFTSFGQSDEWTSQGTDYLSLFKEYRKTANGSLAQDMIADVSSTGTAPGTFANFIKARHGYAGLRSARLKAVPLKTLDEMWPSLNDVFERVFAPNIITYDDVCRAASRETDQLDPIVLYCQTILRSYMHHFTFGETISHNVNEREAFVDSTWCFIRTALTIAKIPSRMMEVQIDGNKERKMEVKQGGARQSTARKADGVGLHCGSQIYVAEAGLMYGASLEKKDDDKLKVMRAMRDSWVSQLRHMCETHRPTAPMIVFGSTSHLHITKFFAMDFVGCFRVSLLSSMVVPLEKEDFANKMKACMLTCIKFALVLLTEGANRKKAAFIHDHDEREELLELASRIPATSNSPVKQFKD
ncbi:hypothetical protein BGZ94_003335 [Podila epigama]|nr:hypothetical protein BGZ94_003335 [Podila epigama]